MTAPGPRIVSFDLMPRDPDYYFVLTEALGEFAARQRADAETEADPRMSIRLAETAEKALERIEEAMTRTSPVGQERTVTETEQPGQALWFADEHARGAPGHTPQRYEDAGGLVQYRCDTCRFDTGVTWEEFCARGRLTP
jgi:hypothetical protein